MSHKTALSVFAAIGLFSSATALAGSAEEAFSAELQQCAAYYQISSEAIAAMNAPQMAAVGDRLKQSAKDAELWPPSTVRRRMPRRAWLRPVPKCWKPWVTARVWVV